MYKKEPINNHINFLRTIPNEEIIIEVIIAGQPAISNRTNSIGSIANPNLCKILICAMNNTLSEDEGQVFIVECLLFLAPHLQ